MSTVQGTRGPGIDRIRSRPQTPATAGPSVGWDRLDVGVVVLFSLCQLYVSFLGQLYILETAMSVVAVVVLVVRPRMAAPLPRIAVGLLVLLLLWLVASVASDLSNQSASSDLLRGFVRVFFLASNLFLLTTWAVRKPHLLPAMWLGYVLSFGVAYVVQPSTYAVSEVWKFSIAVPLTLLTALALDRASWPVSLKCLTVVALGGVHFLLGTRTIAVIALVACLLVWLSRRTTRKLPVWKLLVGGLILGACGVGVVVGYDKLAMSGELGVRAQMKAGYQAGGEYGSLLGGRPESFVAIRMIGQSPLTGNGSYSLPSLEEMNEARLALGALGYEQLAEDLPGLRNYHSELLGTWAENGIAAAAFWLVVAGMLVEAGRRLAGGLVQQPVLCSVVLCMSAWDLLFSPFGADRRLFVGLAIATFMVCAFARPQEGEPDDDQRGDDQLQPGRVPAKMPRERRRAAPRSRRPARGRRSRVDGRIA
jgi:hypothetical protein